MYILKKTKKLIFLISFGIIDMYQKKKGILNMKIITFMLIGIMSLFSLVGCGDDNSSVTPPPTESPMMSSPSPTGNTSDTMKNGMDDMGDAVNDITDGAGNAVKDSVNGVENAVGRMTGNK